MQHRPAVIVVRGLARLQVAVRRRPPRGIVRTIYNAAGDLAAGETVDVTQEIPMAAPRAAPMAGVFPIAPTPFTDSGDLDLDGQRRVLDCMIDQGVDGICILANYSEQFLLADSERDTLLDACLSHVRARVPVIVTCSHFSTRIAAARAHAAAAAGAAMIMLMPPYHGAALRADERGILEHYARVADACNLPIMVQDAPLSGVALSVPFLARLARDVPLVRYFKIEVPGAAAKLRGLIDAGGDAIVGPFDGEESITLMADLDAGATGTMPSALLPDQIKPVLAHHRAGRRADAATAYARILPLINFENRQCGLRAAKAVMAAGGVIKSEAVRHPLEPLHPATRAGLLELARGLDLVALRWGR
jgi:dihydrodipicolinate synthase/N-acetylneuraminate lyase